MSARLSIDEDREGVPEPVSVSERCLVLAPVGRDAAVAATLLAEAGLEAEACPGLPQLCAALERGAGAAVLTEEAVASADLKALAAWIAAQPAWSDFPFILLTHGGHDAAGVAERTPSAGRLTDVLGNVTFLERPFHPTTLVSLVRVALRGRRRQYEARERIEELRAAEETRRMLAAEMQHRLKNTLAVVQAIAAQTFRGAADPALMDAFSGRIQTLTQAHDALTQTHWQPAPIGRVVDRALAPHGGASERFRIDGPEVMLGAKQALALSLALHELATNAAKYGALSNEDGSVAVDWSLSGEESPRLVFSWRESGGPLVAEPTRKGFGSRLIQRSLAAEFNGSVTLDYATTGLVCLIEAPAGTLEGRPQARG